MTELVVVTHASYVSGHRLRLRFSDGAEKLVDFSRWLSGRVFGPLRDVEYFKGFFLSGGTVCWPNGADVAPETLRQADDQSETAA
ncbi:MAG: DUF2442 domain-containing protein [Acidobacteria bacterium]|nr:DUF2442 domain-containing protein [Acidobacteriota bacterium]